jgi:hypothetical protein
LQHEKIWLEIKNYESSKKRLNHFRKVRLVLPITIGRKIEEIIILFRISAFYDCLELEFLFYANYSSISLENRNSYRINPKLGFQSKKIVLQKIPVFLFPSWQWGILIIIAENTLPIISIMIYFKKWISITNWKFRWKLPKPMWYTSNLTSFKQKYV